MGVSFSEYRPSGLLADLVQTYWTGSFNLASESLFSRSVVPNGCVELIIHLAGDHCELVKEDKWGRSPEFMLIGLQTRPYEVRFKKLVRVFGIRFNPEGIYSIFGVPPASFTSGFESGGDVLGKEFSDYCSRLREAASTAGRISLTDTFLVKKLTGRTAFGTDHVRVASETIRAHHGIISLEALTDRVPVSPRQLQREFKRKLGITAKEYMRLSRLNAIQRYMQGAGPVKLTTLAYDGGFSDQSHFIREFRSMTGTNPRVFLKNRGSFIVNPASIG